MAYLILTVAPIVCAVINHVTVMLLVLWAGEVCLVLIGGVAVGKWDDETCTCVNLLA